MSEPIIRYATLRDGREHFDEFIADNASIHFEVMGDNHWWMCVTVDGRDYHINCGNDRARSRGYATCEEDAPQ